ncbi:28735_t:CDS:2 [Racocetra persica]|uniref:28735_t:CDS:1 n=1 Tax=Racocetra persica TaxID=160502 RepID=A0ACA9LFP2_9GLOM|nr:28735_t:CDS:2 [Racocetra persica]
MTDTTTPRKKPQKFNNWEGEDLKEQKKHFYNTYFNQERIHKSFDLTPADKAAIETFKTEILPQLDGWKDSLGDEQQKQEMRRVITTLNNSLLNINDARGASVKFRTSQEVKMEEDPETYMQAKMAVDAFRFNPSLHYSENCRNKIHFLKEELKINLPTSTKFTEDMKAIKGFKSFLEEIKNYLITVKFYQAGGAVVPQQFYLLLGPPGVELIGIAQDYTGKDFGKIVKRMIEGKDRAPVILFDEIDKCSDKEILNTISIIFDDTKNKTDFEDVYFQFPVPMNECFMICTANYLERLEQFVLSRCTRVKIEWLTYEDRIEVAKKELFNALKESKSGIEKYADENGPDYKFTDKFFHRTLVEE